MRWWGWLLAALAMFAIIAGAWVYRATGRLTVETLTPDVHVIFGVGGNVAVLATGKGTVVVDTMTFVRQGERIRALAEQLTGEPVVTVINTHYHLDHTHGNPAFAQGTRVVSTRKTLQHLLRTDADHFAATPALLPGETFADRLTITLGGKTIALLHPGRGHTDGDLVAHFVEDGVLVTGDLHFNGHYPNIDLEAGGSVAAWPASIDRALMLSFDQVIPGHGPVTDRAGLREFRDFMHQLADIGAAAAEAGLSLDDTLATPLLTLDEGYVPLRFAGVSLGLDREFVLSRAWQEATGNFTAYEPLAQPPKP